MPEDDFHEKKDDIVIVPNTLQTTEAVAAHYDELDVFYREVWGDHVHHGYFVTGRETVEEATEALIVKLADTLQLTANQRVVDIGCGYGATARYLAQHRGADVTGLTVSQVQAARAAKQAVTRGSLSFRTQDWLTSDLPAESFDRAYSVESSEHMPDKPQFFAQAFRVLRPGGVFGIYAWLAADSPTVWQVRHLLEPICREGRLPSMATLGEYREMAQAAGFAPEVEEDISSHVSATWTICARRVTKNLLTKPRYARFLADAAQGNRIFLLTLGRLILAYRTKSMRYCLVTYRKPA